MSALPFHSRSARILCPRVFHYPILEDILEKHRIHPVICEIGAPEASGWFREEITSVDDLKGLKMRFFGLGAQVMQMLGVDTQ